MDVTCLDEASALAFVAGDLTPAVRSTVESHVDECTSCRQVLAALVRRGPVARPVAWQAGTIVGRYTIRGPLGHGGMGAVYRADDPMLGRPVALKRLHASADAETRARLVREARAAAQLSDPNVVTIYEVGEVDGTPFIAMELVDGMTLTGWLAERKRPWRAIVDTLAQAGRGLAAAHDRGLIHRDFKPDNVLVDRRGRARVADFGLARAGDVASGDAAAEATMSPGLARMTETGALAGTPAYLSPEVVAGAQPDARSDQYAFAVALFEALHGQHPFAGKTAPALWALMAAGKIRDGGRPVPAWLERHVRRGLEVDPAARFPDVATFVRAITRPPRRWFAIGAAACVVAALAVGGTLWLQRADDRCATAGAPIAAQWPARKLAIAPLAPNIVPALDTFAASWRTAAVAACRDNRSQPADIVAHRDACLERARVGVQALLDQVAHGQTGLLAAADALPDLAPCSDRKELEHGDPVPTAPRDRATLAAAERDLADAKLARDRGELAQAATLLDRASQAAFGLHANALVARVALAKHQLAHDRGDPRAAYEATVEAMTFATSSGDPDLAVWAQIDNLAEIAHKSSNAVDGFRDVLRRDDEPSRELAAMWAGYGNALEDAGRYAEALDAFQQAQSIRAKLLPPDHIERLVGDYDIAGALIMEQKPAEALPILERVSAQLAPRVSPLRREAIDVLHAIAMAHRQLGHNDEALAATREVLARRIQIFGEHAGMTAIAREELGSALGRAGKHAEAAKMREAAIADELAESGPKSLNAAQGRVNLAEDYIDLGRYDDALATLALARPLLVAGEGEHHPEVAIADLAIAHAVVLRAGKTNSMAGLDEARVQLDGVAVAFTKTFGATSQPMSAVHTTVGELEATRGRWAAADAAYAAALAALGDTTGPDRGEVLLKRAHVQWALGQRDQARASATAAVTDFASKPDDLAEARAWLLHPA